MCLIDRYAPLIRAYCMVKFNSPLKCGVLLLLGEIERFKPCTRCITQAKERGRESGIRYTSTWRTVLYNQNHILIYYC